MARIFFLFDASAAAHYYLPRKNEPFQGALTKIAVMRTSGRAFLYLPSFCVAEVFNTFAKEHYRYQTIEQKAYEDMVKAFSDHIRDRAFFCSYDLNRYHNLNLGWRSIYKLEHQTDTEYERLGVDPKQVSRDDVEQKYREQFGGSPRRHYLSSLDLLILGMSIELIRNIGPAIYLVTKDRRLAKIAQKIEIKELGTETPQRLNVIDFTNPNCARQIPSQLTYFFIVVN